MKHRYLDQTLHRLIIAFIVIVTLPSLGFATGFTGQVIGVHEGDTITVLHDGVGQRVRLNGIDCPEKGQPYGSRAKRFTSFLVFGRRVIVQTVGTDQYGRLVADVMMENGRLLNQELVKAGLAWWYRVDSKDQQLAAPEARARLEKRGLWAESAAIAPWQWRKGRTPGHIKPTGP
jgi:micrococcal nuclease